MCMCVNCGVSGLTLVSRMWTSLTHVTAIDVHVTSFVYSYCLTRVCGCLQPDGCCVWWPVMGINFLTLRGRSVLRYCFCDSSGVRLQAAIHVISKVHLTASAPTTWRFYYLKHNHGTMFLLCHDVNPFLFFFCFHDFFRRCSCEQSYCTLRGQSQGS